VQRWRLNYRMPCLPHRLSIFPAHKPAFFVAVPICFSMLPRTGSPSTPRGTCTFAEAGHTRYCALSYTEGGPGKSPGRLGLLTFTLGTQPRVRYSQATSSKDSLTAASFGSEPAHRRASPGHGYCLAMCVRKT